MESRPHPATGATGPSHPNAAEYDIDAETLRELKNVLNKALAEPGHHDASPAAPAERPARQRVEPRFEDHRPHNQVVPDWDDAFDLVDNAAEAIDSAESLIEEARARSEEMAERILDELRVGEAEIDTLEAQVRAAEARAAELEERANEVETKAADTEAAVMRLHDRIEAKLGRLRGERDASGRIRAA
jgi:DNA repair exonuclease SbcCD ATPase subunit